LRGHSSVGLYVLVAIATLFDHNATAVAVVVAMPPAMVPAVVAVLAELRTGTAPVIGILDHDGVGTRGWIILSELRI
jgi:hypothetical protein